MATSFFYIYVMAISFFYIYIDIYIDIYKLTECPVVLLNAIFCYCHHQCRYHGHGLHDHDQNHIKATVTIAQRRTMPTSRILMMTVRWWGGGPMRISQILRIMAGQEEIWKVILIPRRGWSLRWWHWWWRHKERRGQLPAGAERGLLICRPTVKTTSAKQNVWSLWWCWI